MIISVMNNKGGVLKTSIATNVASILSKNKNNTIIVDLDGQGNVYVSFGKNPDKLKYTVLDIIARTKKEDGTSVQFDDVIDTEEGIALDILPCNSDLNFVDFKIARGEIKTNEFRRVLRFLNKYYDYVIVDTPPFMSVVVSMVMSMSDVILLPFNPDQYAVGGLIRMVKVINSELKEINPNIKVLAIPTRVNKRTLLHQDVIELVNRNLGKYNIHVVTEASWISQSVKSETAIAREKLPLVLSVKVDKSTKDRQIEYYNLTNEIFQLMDIDKRIICPHRSGRRNHEALNATTRYVAPANNMYKEPPVHYQTKIQEPVHHVIHEPVHHVTQEPVHHVMHTTELQPLDHNEINNAPVNAATNYVEPNYNNLEKQTDDEMNHHYKRAKTSSGIPTRVLVPGEEKGE